MVIKSMSIMQSLMVNNLGSDCLKSWLKKCLCMPSQPPLEWNISHLLGAYKSLAYVNCGFEVKCPLLRQEGGP